MTFTRRAVTFASILLPVVRAQSIESPVVEIRVASDGDALGFVPQHLICPSGARVRLFLHHASEIINDVHDWVLLKPGAKSAFVRDADQEPDETVIVPSGDGHMVLASTPLCGRGQTVFVEFTAPAPGEYPFVCSIPGHGATMSGGCCHFLEKRGKFDVQKRPFDFRDYRVSGNRAQLCLRTNS
jgi:azurin